MVQVDRIEADGFADKALELAGRDFAEALDASRFVSLRIRKVRDLKALQSAIGSRPLDNPHLSRRVGFQEACEFAEVTVWIDVADDGDQRLRVD